jgi:hypothetical protein
MKEKLHKCWINLTVRHFRRKKPAALAHFRLKSLEKHTNAYLEEVLQAMAVPYHFVR